MTMKHENNISDIQQITFISKHLLSGQTYYVQKQL